MSRTVPSDAPAQLSHDTLLGGRLRYDQPVQGFRAAIDPVLLAAAVPARQGDRVLELGSGAGAAALCLAKRVEGCTVTGVEQDADLVALANENASLNGLAGRVRFVVGDIVGDLAPLVGGDFDHTLANPPFLDADRADLRAEDDPRRRAATIEGSASLTLWLDRLVGALRPKGRLTLIHRADRLDTILAGLAGHAGDIGVLPLWPKAGRPARRVVVTARRGVATPLRLLAGLTLHESDGAYTAAATAILRDGAPLDL